MPSRRYAHRRAAGQFDMVAALFGADNNNSVQVVKETAEDSYATEEVLPTPRTAFTTLAPIYSVKLVHTGNVLVAGTDRLKIRSPRDAVDLLCNHLDGADREHFVVVLLDTKGHIIGVSTVSVGDLSSAIVHPREVFKPAILSNAASIILAHNHPSGDPTPSSDDTAVTRRLHEAGELLGIEVLDHVVIGELGRYVSFKEKGLCP